MIVVFFTLGLYHFMVPQMTLRHHLFGLFLYSGLINYISPLILTPENCR